MKRYGMGAAVALILLLIVWFGLRAFRAPSDSAPLADTSSTPATPAAPTEPSGAEPPRPAASGNPILTELQKEADRIGLNWDEPDEEDLRLNEKATKLSVDDFRKLMTQARNRSASGDERFMAVDLVSRNGSAPALELLKDFVLEPLPVAFGSDPKSGMERETELMLRARALDGIAESTDSSAKKWVREIADRAENSQIADRAHRHKAHLEEGAPSVREQEERALRELLEQPGD